MTLLNTEDAVKQVMAELFWQDVRSPLITTLHCVDIDSVVMDLAREEGVWVEYKVIGKNKYLLKVLV
jgi:hypothetical protein